jgi:S1-C subfamily serine protease
MKNWVLGIAALYLLLPAPIGVLPMDNGMAEAKKRCVVVETGNGIFGTGVILETNLVLTNYHVIEDNSGVKVNGKCGVVTRRSAEKDLALIMTDTPHHPRIEFCNAEQAEDVYYVGNPNGHRGFIVPGSVLGIEGGIIYTNAVGMPGFSGSGVWCRKHDKLVSISFASTCAVPHGCPFSLSTPSKTIKEFLGWDK